MMHFRQGERVKLKLLEDHHLHMIHDTSCRLLEKAGVYFHVPEAIRIALEAGLPVDKESSIVFFPKRVVENAIDSTPEHFVRKGSETKYDIDVGSGELYIGAGSLPLYIVDSNSHTRYNGSYKDMLRFIQIVNKCDHLAIGNAVIKPSDVPDSVVHAVWNQVTVKYTGKPSCCWYADNYQVAHDTIRILEAACGGSEELVKRKTWAVTSCPESCLKWGKSIIGLLEMSRAGVPVEIMDTPFPGSLSPVTLAGTVALSNANILAGIVLTQIINPGAPVVYCIYGGIMDMRVASHVFGTPETALYTAAATQLCSVYKIPSNMTVPAVSSKIPDEQCAFEKMMNALLPALSGVDCLSLFGGILDFGLSASFEQMIIDNEMAAQIKRIRKGFEVKPETLAEDVITSIGHGGNFLETEHTLLHFRDELYFPEISDRNTFAVWEKNGSKDIVARARKIVDEYLSDHLPHSYLPSQYSQEVDRVVEDILHREKVNPEWLESV